MTNQIPINNILQIVQSIFKISSVELTMIHWFALTTPIPVFFPGTENEANQLDNKKNVSRENYSQSNNKMHPFITAIKGFKIMFSFCTHLVFSLICIGTLLIHLFKIAIVLFYWIQGHGGKATLPNFILANNKQQDFFRFKLQIIHFFLFFYY